MDDDERSIRELVATWSSATEAGNAEHVLRLMADDAVFLIPGREPMRGKSAFAAAQAGLEQYRIESRGEIQEIRVFGEWAYCWNRLSVIVTPREGGAAIKRAGDALSILRKQGGKWVIYRDANMLAAVP